MRVARRTKSSKKRRRRGSRRRHRQKYEKEITPTPTPPNLVVKRSASHEPPISSSVRGTVVVRGCGAPMLLTVSTRRSPFVRSAPASNPPTAPFTPATVNLQKEENVEEDKSESLSYNAGVASVSAFTTAHASQCCSGRREIPEQTRNCGTAVVPPWPQQRPGDVYAKASRLVDMAAAEGEHFLSGPAKSRGIASAALRRFHGASASASVSPTSLPGAPSRPKTGRPRAHRQRMFGALLNPDYFKIDPCANAAGTIPPRAGEPRAARRAADHARASAETPAAWGGGNATSGLRPRHTDASAVADAPFLEAALCGVAMRELRARSTALSAAEEAVAAGGCASAMKAGASARLDEAARSRLASHALVSARERNATATIEGLRRELDNITSAANAKQLQLERLLYESELSTRRTASLWETSRTRSAALALGETLVQRFAQSKDATFVRSREHAYYTPVQMPPHPDTIAQDQQQRGASESADDGTITNNALAKQPSVPPRTRSQGGRKTRISRNLRNALGSAVRDLGRNTPPALVAELEDLAYYYSAVNECTVAVKADTETYQHMTQRLDRRLENLQVWNDKLRAQVRSWEKVWNRSRRLVAEIGRTRAVSRNAQRMFRRERARERALNYKHLEERRALLRHQQQMLNYISYREQVVRAGVREQARCEHLTSLGKYEGGQTLMTATAASAPGHVLSGLTKGYGAEGSVTVGDVMASIASIEDVRQTSVGTLEDFATAVESQTQTAASLCDHQREAERRLEARAAELSAVTSALQQLQQATGPSDERRKANESRRVPNLDAEHQLSKLLLKRRTNLAAVQTELRSLRKTIHACAFCITELVGRVSSACPPAHKATDEALAQDATKSVVLAEVAGRWRQAKHDNHLAKPGTCASDDEPASDAGRVSREDGGPTRPREALSLARNAGSARGRWRRGIKQVITKSHKAHPPTLPTKGARKKASGAPSSNGGTIVATCGERRSTTATATAATCASAQSLRAHSRIAAYEHLVGAIRRDDVAAVKSLLEEESVRAVVNRRDAANGTTPLMHAAARGNVATVCLLLDKNADANLGDRARNTAAHYANAGRHLAVAKCLVKGGGTAAVYRNNALMQVPAALLPSATPSLRMSPGTTKRTPTTSIDCLCIPSPGQSHIISGVQDGVEVIASSSRDHAQPRSPSSELSALDVVPSMQQLLLLLHYIPQNNESIANGECGREDMGNGDRQVTKAKKKKVTFAGDAECNMGGNGAAAPVTVDDDEPDHANNNKYNIRVNIKTKREQFRVNQGGPKVKARRKTSDRGRRKSARQEITSSADDNECQEEEVEEEEEEEDDDLSNSRQLKKSRAASKYAQALRSRGVLSATVASPNGIRTNPGISRM